MRSLIVCFALWIGSLAMFVEVVFALDDDRAEIEALLIQINKAVNTKDYPQFQSLLIRGGHYSKLSRNDWESMVDDPKKRRVLLHGYPLPGNKTKFLSVKRQGDRLIYFCETDLKSKNVQTVKAISFQRLDGAWKHYGRSRNVSRARKGSNSAKKGIPTWEDRGGIDRAIRSDPKFQFDHMFRPFSE